jgi:hypothetical protein
VDDKPIRVIATTTEELRQLLSDCTLLSVANSAATELWLLQQRGFGGVDMASPYRQACHILGLALATPEGPNAAPMSEEQWKKAKTLSTRIFDQYSLMYFAKPAEMRLVPEDERKRIYVTMCMFLQYLGSPAMRSGDQWEDRLKALYVPFDDVLRKQLGFSATDYLRLVNYVTRYGEYGRCRRQRFCRCIQYSRKERRRGRDS